MKRALLYLFSSLLALWTLPLLISLSGSLDSQIPKSQEVIARGSELLRLTLSSDQKYRVWRKLQEIPEEIKRAFLLKEDRYFYWHPGFNPVSLIKGAYQTFVQKSFARGGSTLTMQLARLHYGIQTRSIPGKLKQILLAYWLELRLSKKEILEAYFNLAPFGRNIEGLAAASEIYFRKSLSELSVPETLLLAVVPQQPRALAQHRKYQKAPLKLYQKRKLLYSQLVAHDPRYKLWKDAIEIHPWLYSIEDLPFRAPHFVESILQKSDGALLKTTLDTELQALLERKVQSFIERTKLRGIPNAAALLIDHRTMDILAHVGSADFFDSKIFGQVDGTRAKRSPGSTLKPFVYSLAFEQGLIHPKSILFDAPLSYRTPENFDRKYLGPITAEKALIQSRNTPAVALNARIHSPSLYEILKHSEVTHLRAKSHYGNSIVLGGLELSMQELVRLYAMFAHQGVYRKLNWFKDKRERTLRPLFNPDAIAMTLDILQQTPRPKFGAKESFLKKGVPVYWKTGTSFGFRDAWSVGVMGNYVLAVWVGNFSGRAHPELVGSKTAAPLFFQILDGLEPHIQGTQINFHLASLKLENIEVCAVSGKLPTPHCAHTHRSRFLPGVSPIGKCDVHREFDILAKSGKRACHKSKGVQRKRIYEIWPTHIMNLFAKLGVPRSYPPEYSPECGIQDRVMIGREPRILSPKFGMTYTLRLEQSQDVHNQIRFMAEADSDVKTVYWYIGRELLGKTSSDTPLFWKAKPGRYLVKLVDDRGRVATRSLRVAIAQ